MYGALIIGFEYKNTRSIDKWDFLPGISVDLYQIYNYIKTKTTKILIYTDIQSDYRTDILKKAILDGYVDSGLLSFIEDIKISDNYKNFIFTKRHNYIVNNFDTTVIDFISGLDRLFIYYTGHGKNGNIILPDGTQVGVDYIKSLINVYTNDSCEIISIFDCCEADISLLVDQSAKRHISIASTKINEETTTSKTGSKFTRNIIKEIKTSKNINNYLNMHRSHSDIRHLWDWL